MNSPSPSSILDSQSSPLLGTGPDLELDAIAPDRSSREFPVSSFNPASPKDESAVAELDYKTEMAARLAICNRILEKVQDLKSAAGIA